MKEKRPLNPNEAFRRSQKKQAKKQKVERRTQRVKQIPLDRRDPNQLIASIQKYNILDYEGKLTGDGRMHKKRLIDQFNSLKKARALAGMETIDLPEFDPEAYEANKQKSRMGGSGYGAILNRIMSDVEKSQKEAEAFDPETGLPNLPPGEPPYLEGIPGLPPYNISPEDDTEDGVEPDADEPEEEVGTAEPVVQIVYESAPQLIPQQKGSKRPPQKKDALDAEVDEFLRQFS